MKRKLFEMTFGSLLMVLMMICISFSDRAIAQNSISPVRPEEQTRMKPLIEAETKAREALNAKIATMPEAKAFQSAQDELKKATDAFNLSVDKLDTPEAKALRAARDSFQKALEALNRSAEKLPENSAWKEAGAKSLDLAYQIMAEHKLSSREYKPELNAQGDLVFAKVLPSPGVKTP